MPPQPRRKSAPWSVGDKSVTTPLAGEHGTTDVLSSSGRSSLLEKELVKNLKHQIECLEAERDQLKEKLKAATERANITELNRANVVKDGVNGGSFPAGTPEADAGNESPKDLLRAVAPGTCSSAPEGSANQPSSHFSPAHSAGLKFVIDRLQQEHAIAVEALCSERRAKEGAVEEVALLRLLQRELTYQLECSERVYHETLDTLNCEQDKRRELEDRLRNGFPLGNEGCVPATLEDIVAERDYYRIQTDRLRVAQKEMTARIGVVEERLKVERVHTVEVELALHTSLQELETLQALTEKKAVIYERLDNSCTFALKQMRLAAEICEKIRQKLFCCAVDTLSTDSSLLKSMSRELEKLSSALNVSSAFVPDDADDTTTRSKEMNRGPVGVVTEDKEIVSVSPPAVSVPAPPKAVVPPPPRAVIPPPPTASVPLPKSSSAINEPEVSCVALDEELDKVNCQIKEAEAELLQFLNS